MNHHDRCSRLRFLQCCPYRWTSLFTPLGTFFSLLAAAALLPSCAPRSTPATSEAQLVHIAVVGSGVDPSANLPNRVVPINRAQGAAMWRGVQAAWSDLGVSARFPRLRLLHDDDGGDMQEAERIALRLQEDWTILAVIGHATSGSTRSAAWHYAEVGIPLLMPISTSPNVALPPPNAPSDFRLRNTFRLPLNDIEQARAVAYFSLDILAARRIVLLTDRTPNAEEYSATFANTLPSLLGVRQLVTPPIQVSRLHHAMHSVALEIGSRDPDLVLFAGYSQTANDLLSALDGLYRAPDYRDKRRPQILLTDGCMDAELSVFGFDLFISFPAPVPVAPAEDRPALAALLRSRVLPSYELFGYDSVRVLSAALDVCARGLSRACIAQALHRPGAVAGLVTSYQFDPDGEPLYGKYYVYRAVGNLSHLTQAATISRDLLNDWTARQEVRH